MSRIFNFNNIYHCYILGLLWGDGYCNKYSRDKSKYDSLRLETVKTDSLEYEKIFKLANISYTLTSRCRHNKKESQTINVSSVDLTEFIINYQLNQKSKISPNKLLSELTTDNIDYWFRGFFDADGCIYINKINSCTQLYFSGSFEQDWSFVRNYFLSKNITKFSEKTVKGKTSSYSFMRLTNKIHIKSILSSMYSKELFGLSRKIAIVNQLL